MNARSGFEMLVLGTIVKSRQKQEVADTAPGIVVTAVVVVVA